MSVVTPSMLALAKNMANGCAQNTIQGGPGDVKSCCRLMSEFVIRVADLEAADAKDIKQDEAPAPVVQPAGTNLDNEKDEKAENPDPADNPDEKTGDGSDDTGDDDDNDDDDDTGDGGDDDQDDD